MSHKNKRKAKKNEITSKSSHIEKGRQIVKTDGGYIERPEYSASHVDLDTTDYFEERSNPYSSKGN